MKHCDEVVPPYDYDEKITDGRNLKDAHADAYEKTTKALFEIWGPHAEIYSFTSTGHKVSETYTGSFVSFRHLVRKVGKFRCGADIKRLGKVPEMFDQSIYQEEGKRQLLRVWGGSKEGEDRPMLYMHRDGSKKLGEMNATDPALTTIMFQNCLAQYTGNEPLIEVVRQDIRRIC